MLKWDNPASLAPGRLRYRKSYTGEERGEAEEMEGRIDRSYNLQDAHRRAVGLHKSVAIA